MTARHRIATAIAIAVAVSSSAVGLVVLVIFENGVQSSSVPSERDVAAEDPSMTVASVPEPEVLPPSPTAGCFDDRRTVLAEAPDAGATNPVEGDAVEEPDEESDEESDAVAGEDGAGQELLPFTVENVIADFDLESFESSVPHIGVDVMRKFVEEYRKAGVGGRLGLVDHIMAANAFFGGSQAGLEVDSMATVATHVIDRAAGGLSDDHWNIVFAYFRQWYADLRPVHDALFRNGARSVASYTDVYPSPVAQWTLDYDVRVRNEAIADVLSQAEWSRLRDRFPEFVAPISPAVARSGLRALEEAAARGERIPREVRSWLRRASEAGGDAGAGR